MTKSALKGRADDPRACRGVIRATLLTLPLVVFVSLALVPMSANIENSAICVHRCEAYADVTPTEYGYEFLEAVAGEAGLSVNDTVATVTGVTASATGLVVANSTGIVFGASGNRALDNLAEAADYPAWDTLTTEQQTSWGNKTNYDASKFNALLDAYGLEQDRDRFYSTGGANFEFSQNSIDNIKRLGRIGGLWSSKIGAKFSEVYAALVNPQALYGWFPASGTDGVYDSEGVDNWPDYMPRYVNYDSAVTRFGVYYSSSGYWYGFKDISSPVYGVINHQTGTERFGLFAFSKTNFTYDSANEQVRGLLRASQAQQATYNGNVFYYKNLLNDLSNYRSADITINEVNSYAGVADSTLNVNWMGAILFGSSPTSSDPVTVPDYPEEIQPEEDIYYPTEGVNPDTVWNVYITPTRPDNEYNPGNQTGSDEWKQETKQNVLPLQNIKFDKLFPFCLMTDVKDLTEKIEQTITPGQQSDYLTIRIPVAYASNGADTSSEDIEIDGTPVRDLLLMVRPFNQVLLLFFMVFSLVMFWKSILTGD